MNEDSYNDMLEAVQALHDKQDFKNTGGRRSCLSRKDEVLGEISACVSKGKSVEVLAEECADLFILIRGTVNAQDFNLKQAFWNKLQKIMQRESGLAQVQV